MSTKRTMLICTILILGALMVACSCPGAATLGDTAWELESLYGDPVLPGTAITLEFSDGQVSGTAGCNHYGAGYRAGADSLSVSDVFATEMWCEDPEGVMDQEQAYLTALSGAASYRVDGDRLEIRDETGAQILVFVVPGTGAGSVTTPTA